MEKELLYRFFSGEATIAEQTRILDWLDQSDAHRRELLAQRRLFDAMLMHADLRPGRTQGRFSLPLWVRRTVGYAAVLAVVACLGGFYLSGLYGRLAEAVNTVSVPAGQRADVTLPDGTKVCMNALSELRYPAFFVGKKRRVELRGEAFFDVVRDEKHPFVVETYACDVEVLGTRFDVEARAERDEFSTALLEGRVRVTDKLDPRNRVLLQPNQQARRFNGRLVVGRLPGHERFQWREGLIAFRDAPFRELLSEFEKYYDVKIETLRADVTDKCFTGKIRISEGIDHALRVLQQSAPFSFRRSEDRNVIYIQ